MSNDQPPGPPSAPDPGSSDPDRTPPPPANPYGSPPPGQPQYGPPYGQPQYSQPQYGPPYGQPQYAQPQYGQPAPGYPGQQPPRTGMSTGAKVALFSCLGVVAVFGLLVVGGIILAIVSASDETAVDDLAVGDCVLSEDIAQNRDSIGSIETIACDQPHDAEVYAVTELDAARVDELENGIAAGFCATALSDVDTSLLEIVNEGLQVQPLTEDEEPSVGDVMVCLVRRPDGEQLDEPQF